MLIFCLLHTETFLSTSHLFISNNRVNSWEITPWKVQKEGEACYKKAQGFSTTKASFSRHVISQGLIALLYLVDFLTETTNLSSVFLHSECYKGLTSLQIKKKNPHKTMVHIIKKTLLFSSWDILNPCIPGKAFVDIILQYPMNLFLQAMVS